MISPRTEVCSKTDVESDRELHEQRTTPRITVNTRSRLTGSQDCLPLPSPTPVIDENKSFSYCSNTVCYKASGHSDSVLGAFNSLRKAGEFCDVTLVVNNREFKCHKALLSANSPYFKSMFSGAMTECYQKRIVLHEASDIAMEQIIDYFYTSSLTLSMDNVAFILPTSCMLQVDNVTDACCKYMQRNIGVANCLGVAAFADTHSCYQLKASAEEYAIENFSDVVQADEFLQVEAEQLVKLIASENLNVYSEERVYEAAMAWIKYDISNRKKYISDLLKYVKLPLMNSDFLLGRVKNEDTILSDRVALDLLFEAMQYHLKPEAQPDVTNHRFISRKPTSKVQIMVAVGGMGRREPTASVEMYNMASKKWMELSPMAIGRWGADCAALDGHVYVVGGSDDTSRLNSVERYDTSRDQWSPVPPMGTARNGVGVTAVNGYLYAIGGFDGTSPLKSGEQYSPRKGKWTAIPDMKDRRFGVGVCSLDGIIYAIGGSDGTNLNSAECYDTNTNLWSTVAAMTERRKYPGVAAIGGKVYAVGGCNNSSRHNSVECYDLSIDQWTTVNSMLSCRSGLGLAVLDGFLYAVGGYDGGNYLSSSERYDPLSNEWTVAPSMYKSRDCVGITVMTVQKQPSNNSSANSDHTKAHTRQHSS